jgi:aryl-alcohol dehydrogenase (NADP+)
MAHNFYWGESDFAIVERVKTIAANHGVKPAQIALAWMLHKPGLTSPIVGASKMYHLEEAVAAVDISLTDDEIKMLEEPYQPRAILGHR